MDTDNYPGKGLSLPQLVFALNEELKRMGYSSPYVMKCRLRLVAERHTECLCRFSLEAVCQLDRDVLTALAAIHEWKNSFVHVNRIPSNILSLIPIHLTCQKDRFNATSVCRHWRRTFLRCGALWSKLLLENGEVYVKTFLERAKGTPLDIVTKCYDSLNTIMLLSPHARQIRSLEFIRYNWRSVLKFCTVDFGPLPLLHTLDVATCSTTWQWSGPLDTVTAPSPTLFKGAVNLENFLFSGEVQRLSHFAFPKLITFKLSTPAEGPLEVLDLFDFLEASPTLRTVEIRIIGKVEVGETIIASVLPEDMPPEMVVILPNVETFSLFIMDGTHVFDLAAHIYCVPGQGTHR